MRILCALVAVLLAGCDPAPTPPPVAVQPITITPPSFCPTLCAALRGNPGCRPRWAATDDPRTVADARKVGAVVASQCNPNNKPASP